MEEEGERREMREREERKKWRGEAGTEEMMQPCIICLRVISSVAQLWALCTWRR